MSPSCEACQKLDPIIVGAYQSPAYTLTKEHFFSITNNSPLAIYIPCHKNLSRGGGPYGIHVRNFFQCLRFSSTDTFAGTEEYCGIMDNNWVQ